MCNWTGVVIASLAERKKPHAKISAPRFRRENLAKSVKSFDSKSLLWYELRRYGRNSGEKEEETQSSWIRRL